jgi:5'-3' exonuclease
MMKDACGMYYAKRAIMHADTRKDAVKLTIAELDHYPILHKFQQSLIDPTKDSWHADYYNQLFNVNHAHEIGDICKNYIEGVMWVAKYYLDPTNASWTWSYKYTYAPLITDMTNFTKHVLVTPALNNSINYNTKITEEYFEYIKQKSHLQLLYVFPPSSANLIPDRYRGLMSNMINGCVHYYPTSFRISTFLKYYMWECTPYLPEIDIIHLINQSKEC